MAGHDLISNNILKAYMEKYDGLIFVNENINGDFIYRCYYDYVEKHLCTCIECVDCLKNECKILFNKFNVIIGENGYDYDNITEQTPILVEMELFTGNYIKKTVPASYIIKMLDYKGGEDDD